MTLQGRPPHEAGWHGEVFRSPSSPEEDPPKTNSVEKGYDPNYKIYALVIVFKSNAGYFFTIKVLFVYLQLGRGLTPLQALCGKSTL